MARRKKQSKVVETILHEEATRTYIPTAEFQSVLPEEDLTPIQAAFVRRNPDLDPQLVWRGKDLLDWSDLVVPAPPLYIQEKIHPKVLIDDLVRQTQATGHQPQATQLDLFADFNGVPDEQARTEFYQHDANWTNRMILGDSLQVMASLAEREGLYGKVQMIYIDPPYGIKFNSNFQWSTTSRDVKDGKAEHITREPEQVKAFRDTWRDGIHSYLTYLRDRLTVARDLLTESGSIFVQIGDENVHRVRALMDEVFGEENFVSLIVVWKTSSQTSAALPSTCDYIVWFCKNRDDLKYRNLFTKKDFDDPTSSAGEYKYFWLGDGEYITEKKATDDDRKKLRRFRPSPTTSQSGSETTRFLFKFNGQIFKPGTGGWKSNQTGFERLAKADRIMARMKSISYVRFLEDFPVVPISELWTDVRWGFDASQKRYVVETNPRVIQRCILMTTDPGDLVLDPTCGSGTTAYVAEQWGRRWITIDTSRVALALARARLMGARYPYYLLADSPEGRKVMSEQWAVASGDQPPATDHQPLTTTHYSLRQGFVYQRVPHITLKSIANNAEIDVIWEEYQTRLEPLRAQLNQALGTAWEEWEIPRQPILPWPPEAVKLYEGIGKVKTQKTKLQRLYQLNQLLGRSYTLETLPDAPGDPMPEAAIPIHQVWWEQRMARQQAIDASIAAKADYEYLYDKPYEDKSRVRVAGPFTVESLSPHRVLGVDENDELIDPLARLEDEYAADFVQIILENLRAAGVQQAHKEDKIEFTSLTPWPGTYICAEGRVASSGQWPAASDQRRERGPLPTNHQPLPEFGTVTRPDLVAAAREASEAGFDVLIALAFSYDARSTEFDKLGRIPVLKARMNADLHMAEDLKTTGKGNLFVIFGEPDVEVVSGQWLVTRNGRLVVNYEQCKKLSGLDSLAEINRLGGDDLSRFKELSSGDQPHARWPQAVAAIQALKPSDFPLALSTNHYTQVTIRGVDVFHPNTGEIRSDGAEGIACWFIDTDYNEESFFVRHAYFLGAGDPYKALKTSLKAEIDPDAWATLYSDI